MKKGEKSINTLQVEFFYFLIQCLESKFVSNF